ncbi:MAG: phosphotransferase enzyme family protein [Chloroflexota bacterium]
MQRENDYGNVAPAALLKEVWGREAPPAEWVVDQSFTGKAYARLEANDGPVCLRRFPVGTSPHWLEAVHGATTFLERRGFRLFPRILATETGETVIRHSGYRYELSAWAPGDVWSPEDLCDAQLTGLGEAVARLHVVGSGAPGPPVRFDWLTGRQALTQRLAWDPVPRGPDAWQRSQSVAAYFGTLDLSDQPTQASPEAREVVEVARSTLRWLDRAGPELATLANGPPTLTHGDLWPDHVRFSGHDVTALVDLDTLALRPPLGDLAALCADFGHWDAARFAVIVAAYRRHRSVSDEAIAALPRLGALRTLGILRQRIRAWQAELGRSEPGAALRGPVSYWCAQLRRLTALDPESWAIRPQAG